MSPELVTVTIDGQRWTAFETITVEASVQEAARTCAIEIAAEIGAAATHALFRAGARIAIYGNTDLLFTGYVDRRKPHLSFNQAYITVEGRSKGADAVDSAAGTKHATGRFEDKSPLDIAQELDVFDVGFTSSMTLDKVPMTQVVPGETLFQLLSRLAQQQNGNLKSKADGGIEFWNAKTAKRQAGNLIEGQNLKVITADHNWRKRHSHHHVRGQRRHGRHKENLRIEAIAEDEGVDRYRPSIAVQEEDTDDDRARGRAETRRDRAAGNSLSVQAEVQSFRDDTGALFEAGNLVYTESPFADVKQDMLIEHVSWHQSQGGSLTRLTLVDPRAHAGKGPKFSKSGKAWKATHSKAS